MNPSDPYNLVSAGLQTHTATPGFLCVCWRLNSGPHACHLPSPTHPLSSLAGMGWSYTVMRRSTKVPHWLLGLLFTIILTNQMKKNILILCGLHGMYVMYVMYLMYVMYVCKPSWRAVLPLGLRNSVIKYSVCSPWVTATGLRSRDTTHSRQGVLPCFWDPLGFPLCSPTSTRAWVAKVQIEDHHNVQGTSTENTLTWVNAPSAVSGLTLNIASLSACWNSELFAKY